MVGGFAAILNGISRTTNDADIWLKDTVENKKALRKALKELEIGDFEPIETMQLIPGFSTIYLNTYMELDVFTDMKYFQQESFDSCYKMAIFAEVDGFKIPFLHINHLLLEKKANNRPKDQLDIQELEKIQQLLNNPNK
jgi:hypothetical protein